MANKKRTPAWLGVILALVLAILVSILLIAPEPQQSPPPLRLSLPTAPSVTPVAPTMPDQPVAKQKPIHLPARNNMPAHKKTARVGAPPLLPARSERGSVALIIDDVGYDIRALRRILSLPVPVAISVLPDSPHAVQAARLAHQSGQTVMLHLPMQPQDPSLKMDAAFLVESMSESELQETFRHNLAQVPYVEGVNNHMGSKLTESVRAMQPVMEVCRQKGLFFVDSRTSPDSIAAKTASNAGVRWASRQIFLDHMMTEEAMEHAWNRARRCMSKEKRCIIIAHPRTASVDFLERHLTKQDAALMVPIQQLLRPGMLNAHERAVALQGNAP